MLGVSITAEGEFAQTGLADATFSLAGAVPSRRGRPAPPPFRPDSPLPFRPHLLTLDRPDGPVWRSALCGLNVGWRSPTGLAEGRRARRFRSRRSARPSFRPHLLTLDRPDGPVWRSALCGLNAGSGAPQGLPSGGAGRRASASE